MLNYRRRMGERAILKMETEKLPYHVSLSKNQGKLTQRKVHSPN
jgi:hypothetical protein